MVAVSFVPAVLGTQLAPVLPDTHAPTQMVPIRARQDSPSAGLSLIGTGALLLRALPLRSIALAGSSSYRARRMSGATIALPPDRLAGAHIFLFL